MGGAEEAGDWEDVDGETLSKSDLEEDGPGEEPGDCERKLRIKRGQAARAAVRARGREINNTCMPPRKDVVGNGIEGNPIAGVQEGSRRTSTNRPGLRL